MLHKILVNSQVREIEIATSELISTHYEIAIAIVISRKLNLGKLRRRHKKGWLMVSIAESFN